MLRRLPLLLVLVAVSAGCAGDDGGSTTAAVETTTPKPTKTQWAVRADEICARDQRRLAKLAQPESLEGVAAYLEQSLRIARAELRKLRALEPPPKQAPTVRRLLNELQKVIRALEAVRRHAAAGKDVPAGAAADRASIASTRAQGYAVKLGLTKCAHPSQIQSPRGDEFGGA